jgi:hypothetical protein
MEGKRTATTARKVSLDRRRGKRREEGVGFP